MPPQAAFSLAAAYAGSFLAVTVTHALSLSAQSGLVLVSVVVTLCSIDVAWPTSVGIALLGWLFLMGFVTNNYGELHINDSRDGWRLLLLTGIAVTCAAAGPSGLRSDGRLDAIFSARRPATLVVVPTARKPDLIGGEGTVPLQRSVADDRRDG